MNRCSGRDLARTVTVVGPFDGGWLGGCAGETWASASDHAKAVKEMSVSGVGGGHHLKEMYVLRAQGKCETCRKRVLLKHQEQIRRETKSMEQDMPGGEDGGQVGQCGARVRRERLRATSITRRFW